MTPHQFIRSATAIAGATFFLIASTASAQTATAPKPPCAQQANAHIPAYGEPGAPPTVAIWHDLNLTPVTGCPEALRGPMKLVVVLTGTLPKALSADDIAARIGAISRTKGLEYWSVTDAGWRTLLSEAFALRAPDTETIRDDFTAREVLGGLPLHFAQNDTRSTGLNVYRLTAQADGPDRLTVRIVNVSQIRFTLVPLFGARDLLSVHFFNRLENGAWGYYGLSAVRSGSVAGHDKSYVNRAAAYYRFLAGQPGNAAPPLAP